MRRFLPQPSNAGNKYSSTTGNCVQQNLKFTIDQMKDAARIGNNETIIKDSLSLFDDLDRIMRKNKSEQQKLITVFKKNGYGQ